MSSQEQQRPLAIKRRPLSLHTVGPRQGTACGSHRWCLLCHSLARGDASVSFFILVFWRRTENTSLHESGASSPPPPSLVHSNERLIKNNFHYLIYYLQRFPTQQHQTLYFNRGLIRACYLSLKELVTSPLACKRLDDTAGGEEKKRSIVQHDHPLAVLISCLLQRV